MAQRLSSSLKPLLARRTMAGLSSRPSLAILDDYLGTSAPHFAHITSDKLQITIFKDTEPPAALPDLIERLQPFDLISTMRERTAFPRSLLSQLPNLKLLLATGTQFETFDLAAAQELGIPIVAAPGLGRTDEITSNPPRPNIKKGGGHPTTQHTWALIPRAGAQRRQWTTQRSRAAQAQWQSGLATGLTGRTLGVVGLGRLGAAVARIAHLAWGMRVVCWSASLTQDKADAMAAEVGLSADEGIGGGKTFRAVGKDELFQSCGRRGVALDTFDVEPLLPDSPWRRADYWGKDGRSRVLTTPHMGYVDEDLMNTWYAETAENVDRWLADRDLLHRLV
ncbi:glycerate dehydrogenase [Mycena olivaceomarginata]|nr:glycerate dehydrogenase [Mycena olivaceomarginata]